MGDYETVNVCGLHTIDDCLSEGWVEAWAGTVVSQIEEYLRKHAAFEAFLETRAEATSAG
jgi:hypothetical protein